MIVSRWRPTLWDNLNPLAAAFYGVSTVVCVRTSAQCSARRRAAGERCCEAGTFTRIRRATETP